MPKRILVVEDDATIRDTLTFNLKKEGYAVTVAQDGADGVAKARSSRPDLILLDLMLPELNGLEVCRILRQEGNVPIIMLTAKESEVDKVIGLQLGADDYITKPFSLRELFARMTAVLRRSEQRDVRPEVEEDRLGRLRIDRAGRRAMVDDSELKLTPKDLADATVVTLYMSPGVNNKLAPLLKKLKPGTRIVSHDFDMGDWKPEQTLNVDGATIYYWTITPDLARRAQAEPGK